MTGENSQVRAENSIDVALLAKAGDGCRASFSQLYRRFYPVLTRFAYRYIQAPDAIEEVVNDTMLAVWQQATSFRGDSKVSTWIMGIAARKCWQAAKKFKNPSGRLRRWSGESGSRRYPGVDGYPASGAISHGAIIG